MSETPDSGRSKQAQSTSDSTQAARPSEGHGPSGAFARLRRVPRVVWLTLSATVLFVATVAWCWRLRSEDPYLWSYQSHRFLTTEWWREVPVSGADSALPEISGRIYGVAVQTGTYGELRRVWIVGASGLLGYSQDDGHCWTFYEYDNQRGEFHKPKRNPCQRETRDAVLHWPEIVPTVLAAPRAQSAGPPEQYRQQAPPQQQRQQGTQQPNASPAQKKAYSADQNQQSGAQAKQPGQVRVFPTAINFGDVILSPPTGGKSAPPSLREITVSNRTSEDVHVSVSGFSADSNGEFSLRGPENGCSNSPLVSGKECQIGISFTPRTTGQKQVFFEVQDSFSGKAVTIKIDAFVHPYDFKSTSDQKSPASAENPPSVSKEAPNTTAAIPGAPPPTKQRGIPPRIAPDLLTIEFDPVGGIVSTGGSEWRLTKNELWIWMPMPNPSRERVGRKDWVLTAPSTGGFATETRVNDPDDLILPSDRYGCTDCTIRDAISSGSDAWAVGWSTDTGDHGVVLHSVDGGKSWQPVTRGTLPPDRRATAAAGRPWRWMPRWYLAILILSLALAAPALRPPPRVEPTDAAEAQSGSVEGRLSSDKPLSPGEHDVLGLTSIALGLSRFLRNEKTLPPLTVAINGEWGSGKSSLMNLLRCDLKSYGMFPVWFNAWHHQKEEHLLAALLQTVRLEAVPPLWDLLGVPFRARLLWYRLRRRWPVLVLIAAVLIFLVVLDYHVRVDEHSDLFLWLTSQLVPSLKPKPAEPVSAVPVQGGLLALVTVIGVLWKGLTAFGANPASLLASVAQGNKMKDLDAQTSFRQKFAVEFSDFTRALGQRRPLAIFIDDLDRCLPSNVRDVLEAVNFLVSSGDCFVVLGMDRLQVQRAVGLSFKKVAEEAGLQPGGRPGITSPPVLSGDDADWISREKRAEFAQRYLEKLINLEVRVPQAVDDTTKQRLFERPPEPKHVHFPERALRVGLNTLQLGVPVALAVLLLAGGYELSLSLAPAVEQSMKQSRVVALAPTAASAAGSNPGSPPATTQSQPSGSKAKAPTDAAGPEKQGQKVAQLVPPFGGPPPTIELRDALPARWILSVPFYLTGIFLLLVANVVLTTRPGVVTKDSKQFTNAMEKVWYPLVLAKQNTPRAAKRFVNRVRYLAMRQRAFHEDASMWEQVLFPQRLREPEGPHDWRPIPEPLLVAMAAIEQMEPSWIYDANAFSRLAGSDGKSSEPLTSAGVVTPATALLEAARAKHLEVFSDPIYVAAHADWKSLPNYRSTFLAIWPRTDLTEPE